MGAKRIVWFIAAALVVAAAVATLIRPQGRGRQAEAATKITIYQPTGFTATERAEGQCWTGSLAAPRAGAFRCSVGNVIHDPCFVTNGEVACPVGEPAAHEGVLIQLAKPLPAPPLAWENPPDPDHPSPWWVRLAGGGDCGVLTGTRLPDYPLGCRIPAAPEGQVCTMPAPLAETPAAFATTCGVWSDARGQVVDRKVYAVTEMWL